MANDDVKKAMDAATAARKPLAPRLAPPLPKPLLTPQQMADAEDSGLPKDITTSAPIPKSNLAARLNPAAHRQAIKSPKVEDAFDYPVAFRMAFVGSGQGGGRIANAFWNIGYRRVGIFNTTEQDFHDLAPEIPKLSLDIGGAGKDMQLARNSVKGRDEEVRDLYARAWGPDPDCVLVCVSLGGGTGSGTALPLIELARSYMDDKGRPPRVGAVVSLPSPNDGQMIARNAVTAFTELIDAKVSPLLIIDNDRVNQVYQPSMRELLSKSNEVVSQLFHLFNQYAAEKSSMTFDRMEFLQLLDGGIVTMSAADIDVTTLSAPSDVSTAIRQQLEMSVLAQVDLRRGKKGACVFVGDQATLDAFGRDYFDAGFNMMDRTVGSSLDNTVESVIIHRGLYQSQQEGSGLQCYIMISELPSPAERLQQLAKKAGLSASAPTLAKHLRVE